MVWLKRMALVLLAPVALLALAEGVLRLLDLGYPTRFLVQQGHRGQTRWVDNPCFGFRFFPPRQVRLPAAIALPGAKPAGTYRVVLLGESAALGDPMPELGPARFLQLLLAEAWPERRVEVVNAAMTAINSHVIAEIAQELVRFQPDALVVYMGNNEVVGPYGPGTVFAPSARGTRARVLLTRLRLAQMLRLRQPEAGWAGLSLFEGRELEATDPRLAGVHARFAANLDRILAAARRAGVPVVLSTVAVNLRDCAPFSGAEARQAYAAGRYEEARDLDRLRFRADGAINDLIRRAAGAAGPGVTLVDTARDWGVPGHERFVDHVHFTPEGTYELARGLAGALAPGSVGPDLDTCLARLVYNPWFELDMVTGMLERRARFPFLGQPGNARWQAALEQHRAELQPALAAADAASLRPRFQAAQERRPGDPDLLSTWAQVLINLGAYDEAGPVLRYLVAEWPHRLNYRGALALVLAYQGRAAEGVRILRDQPARSGPLVDEFLLGAARRLNRERRPEAAVVMADAVLAAHPGHAEARLERAASRAALGRPAEAEADYRAVWMRHPGLALAREELTGFLALQGRWEEAEAVLRSGGEGPENRLRYAEFLLAKKDRAGAEREVQRLEQEGYAPEAVRAVRERLGRAAP